LVQDPITNVTSYKFCQPIESQSATRGRKTTGSLCLDTNIYTDYSSLQAESDYDT